MQNINREPQNVGENYEIYDTCRIGTDPWTGPPGYPGGMRSFVELAMQEEIPFLNIRNESDGRQYCNVETKEKMAYAFDLESLGLRFTISSPWYRDPGHHGAAELAKVNIWLADAMEESYFELKINEDTVIETKPAMLPAGFGATGHTLGHYGGNSNTQLVTNGETYLKNRFGWGNDCLQIPRDAHIAGKLVFSDYGKQLLTATGHLYSLIFGDGPNPRAVFPEAKIELTLRGRRYVQQRGELHFMGVI